MAINQNELEISNKSYTNKDFEAIYTELMDYATKLTKRFDPTDTNESDPFIVLLKLLAFIGDKVNYNADKNLLESFMTSCTQDKSMRQLTEMLGYSMHYYIAAETSVVFKYDFPTDGSVPVVKVPRFSIVANDTNDVQFVTKNNVDIVPESGVSANVDVIQGVLKDLVILDNPTIQLENIDENNRVYFPETFVAQNGVFIEGGSSHSDSWELVDNLNTQAYNSAVYKFSYDSDRSLPYIEFPDWISNIIGAGLSIKYIVTDGVNGNVKARGLTSVTRAWDSSNPTDTVEDQAISVINANAAISGQNPETIDESYKGFKKIVGTFDTLITCRDYLNAIFNMTDNNGNHYVSNVQVADRRTDLNYGCTVVSYGNNGMETISVPSGSIQASDLCIYPFKPITDTSFSSIDANGGYYDSFKLLTDTSAIEYNLESEKSISHDYKQLNSGDILAIKNYYILTAIITTSTKVNAIEQLEILQNVNGALAKNYNARQVDFGYEISYDELLGVIENSDERIKSVSLYEPDQVPYIYTKSGVTNTIEAELYDADGNPSTAFKSIVAKNILSGRVSLFEYDESFLFNYTQSAITKIEGVAAVTSEARLASIAPDGEYTLLQNEAIQFIAPKLLTKVTYPYGVNYYLRLTTGTDFIQKDADYTLKSDEYCVFEYYNGDDQEQVIIYGQGDIIKPNFDMYTSEYRLAHNQTPKNPSYTNPTKLPSYLQNIAIYTLTAKQEVAYKIPNETTLTTSKLCYWYLNNDTNTIPWDSDNSYILEDNEYFFYTDTSYSTLNSYGAGTKLTVAGNISSSNWTAVKNVDLEKLTEDGLSSLGVFVSKVFDSNNTLTITEQEIVTLTENDKIKVEVTAFAPQDNVFTSIGTSVIKYVLAGDAEEVILPDKQNLAANYGWKARALLDINCGSGFTQQLVGNQRVTLILDDTAATPNTVVVNQPSCISADHLTSKGGGVAVPVTYTDLNLRRVCPAFIEYTLVDPEIAALTDTSNNHYYNFILDSDTTSKALAIPAFTYYTYTLLTTMPANWALTYSDYFVYDSASNYYKHNTNPDWNIVAGTVYEQGSTAYYRDRYMMVYVAANGGSVSVDAGNVYDFLLGDTTTVSLTQGLHVLRITGAATTVTFSYASPTIPLNFTISNTRTAVGINPLLGKNMDSSANGILKYIRDNLSTQFSKFFVNHYLDEAKQIELSAIYPMDSAQAFYDYNNIANRWVISEIDFKKSDIKIAKSSTK